MRDDWKVDLMSAFLPNSGAATWVNKAAEDGTDSGLGAQTKWTIGDDVGAAGGSHTGSLYNDALNAAGDALATDPTGQPTLAAGTFHATHGTSGSMVGAFGARRK